MGSARGSLPVIFSNYSMAGVSTRSPGWDAGGPGRWLLAGHHRQVMKAGAPVILGFCLL
jgi:hypothetical protein